MSVGPNSVEYRIKQEALCFGGTQCTTTDIAMAAGVAPNDICQVPEEALSGLSPQLVYAAMREMRKMIETAIDSMKVTLGLLKKATVRNTSLMRERYPNTSFQLLFIDREGRCPSLTSGRWVHTGGHSGPT